MTNFIALYVFNDIETCRPYKVMINLKIVKFLKSSSGGLQIIITFVGVDQIICKNGNKSSWMHGHQILLSRNRLEQSPSVFTNNFKWNETPVWWNCIPKARRFL